MGVSTSKYGFFKQGNTVNVTDSSADFIGVSKEELEQNTRSAEEAILLNRVDLRSKGYTVEALERKATAKNNNYGNDRSNDELGAGNSGIGLEAHPELPFMGGKADQLFIPGIEDFAGLEYEAYLSEAQKDQITAKKKRKDAELKEQLKNRMKNAPKFAVNLAPKQQPKNTYKYKEVPRKRALPRLTPNGG